MLTRRLWLLLTILLFKEVGLDEADIVRLLGRAASDADAMA